jgi:hypothetical protein
VSAGQGNCGSYIARARTRASNSRALLTRTDQAVTHRPSFRFALYALSVQGLYVVPDDGLIALTSTRVGFHFRSHVGA